MKAVGAICDANVLIDYYKADEDLIRELVRFWENVFVPDIVLHEVHQISLERAEGLGLEIVETPLRLPVVKSLSLPDRACLYFVIENGWTCIANDRKLRKECISRGCTPVWGLEMLLTLVSAARITPARARDAAIRIEADNPLITRATLAEFLHQLGDIKMG
jgi:rRNA-processing protein FCF1